MKKFKVIPFHTTWAHEVSDAEIQAENLYTGTTIKDLLDVLKC